MVGMLVPLAAGRVGAVRAGVERAGAENTGVTGAGGRLGVLAVTLAALLAAPTAFCIALVGAVAMKPAPVSMFPSGRMRA
jgi:hypothetical protein